MKIPLPTNCPTCFRCNAFLDIVGSRITTMASCRSIVRKRFWYVCLYFLCRARKSWRAETRTSRENIPLMICRASKRQWLLNARDGHTTAYKSIRKIGNYLGLCSRTLDPSSNHKLDRRKARLFGDRTRIMRGRKSTRAQCLIFHSIRKKLSVSLRKQKEKKKKTKSNDVDLGHTPKG